MDAEADYIERDTPADHCIACSPTNPRGLHLRFRRQGPDAISTEVTLHRDFCGWAEVAHGGIVTLLLDEVASWCVAACRNERRFATREIQVRFVKPTPVEQPLRATARITGEQGPRVELEAEVRLVDGNVQTARARVEIVRFDEARYRRFRTAVEPPAGEGMGTGRPTIPEASPPQEPGTGEM